MGNFGWGLAKQIFKTEKMLKCNYRGVQGKNALSQDESGPLRKLWEKHMGLLKLILYRCINP